MLFERAARGTVSTGGTFCWNFFCVLAKPRVCLLPDGLVPVRVNRDRLLDTTRGPLKPNSNSERRSCRHGLQSLAGLECKLIVPVKSVSGDWDCGDFHMLSGCLFLPERKIFVVRALGFPTSFVLRPTSHLPSNNTHQHDFTFLVTDASTL